MKKFICVVIILLPILSCNKDIKEKLLKPNVVLDYSLDNSHLSKIGPYYYWYNSILYPHYQGIRLTNCLNLKIKDVIMGSSSNHINWYDDERTQYLINGKNFNEYYHKSNNFDLINSEFGERKVVLSRIKDNKVDYSHELYFPKPIIVDINKSGFRKAGKGSNVYEIKRGSTIYFEPDYSNKNGLLVSLEYRGLNKNPSFEEIQKIRDSGRESIKTLMFVPYDIGEVHLSEDFLKKVPNDGMILLLIVRGSPRIFNLNSSEANTLIKVESSFNESFYIVK